MKHLRLFETTADYESAKETIVKPYVALTEDSGKVYYGQKESTPTYEYVDLGLPSGLKWAKCNVGATSEEEAGLYFQWGDVEGRTADEVASKPCIWSTAPFNNGSRSCDVEYFASVSGDVCPNGVLASQYDAAYQASNGAMRMPTQAEIEELIANTTSQWIEDYESSGVSGRKFTSKTDSSKYIFIPAVGYAFAGSVESVDYGGFIRTSNLDTSYLDIVVNAWHLAFDSFNMMTDSNYRIYGESVRGVHS